MHLRQGVDAIHRSAVIGSVQTLLPRLQLAYNKVGPPAGKSVLVDSSKDQYKIHLVELSNMFFELFGNFRPTIDLFALFLGDRDPSCENIGRDLHFAPVVGPF